MPLDGWAHAHDAIERPEWDKWTKEREMHEAMTMSAAR